MPDTAVSGITKYGWIYIKQTQDGHYRKLNRMREPRPSSPEARRFGGPLGAVRLVAGVGP
jgi:hypothetical protein